MDIRELFEKILNDYDAAWFQDGETKFFKHPSNKDHADSFTIYVEIPTENNQFIYQEKQINIKDFLKGKRDDHFDAIHDELQESENVETIGEIEPGVFDQRIKDGHQIISSTTFYPEKSLNTWRNEILKEVNSCLKLLNSLYEKDVFLNFIVNECRRFRQNIEEHGFVPKHQECLKDALDEVQSLVTKQNERIVTLQSIIFENEERLPFNMSAAQLNRLILLLIEKGYLNVPNDNVTKFFERHCTVMDKGKIVKPATLSSSFRRLNSKKKSATNKAWAKSIDLNL